MATIKGTLDRMNKMNHQINRMNQIAQGPQPKECKYNGLSDMDLKAMRDSVSDPTGLRPHFEKLNDSVQKIDNGLESEREERKKADAANNKSLEAIQSQFDSYVKSHRHDTLKQILVGIVVALISSVISILVTRAGLF